MSFLSTFQFAKFILPYPAAVILAARMQSPIGDDLLHMRMVVERADDGNEL